MRQRDSNQKLLLVDFLVVYLVFPILCLAGFIAAIAIGELEVIPWLFPFLGLGSALGSFVFLSLLGISKKRSLLQAALSGCTFVLLGLFFAAAALYAFAPANA